MAVAFSHQSLPILSHLPSIHSQSKTLASLNLRAPHPPGLSNLGFPSFSPIHRRSIKIAASDSTTIDGDGEDIDQKKLPLKTFIQVYKEATLEGDEKTVSDLESIFCSVEAEKNELLQKVTQLSTDILAGKDKFIRIKADFENFRKRLEKDRLTLTSDVQGEVIESLLPMVDNFERAKEQLKPETEKEKKIDTSYQGIYKQFVEIMKSLRVSVVETVGKPFNPLIHEAVAREESQVFKEGIVIEEVHRGFSLGERLLRSAMVKVSAGSGPKKTPAANGKFVEQPTATARSIED